MKFCKDCKYFLPLNYTKKGQATTVSVIAACAHPNVTRYDLVWGNARYQRAEEVRIHSAVCGLMGSLWEAK